MTIENGVTLPVLFFTPVKKEGEDDIYKGLDLENLGISKSKTEEQETTVMEMVFFEIDCIYPYNDKETRLYSNGNEMIIALDINETYARILAGNDGMMMELMEQELFEFYSATKADVFTIIADKLFGRQFVYNRLMKGFNKVYSKYKAYKEATAPEGYESINLNEK